MDEPTDIERVDCDWRGPDERCRFDEDMPRCPVLRGFECLEVIWNRGRKGMTEVFYPEPLSAGEAYQIEHLVDKMQEDRHFSPDSDRYAGHDPHENDEKLARDWHRSCRM